MRRNPLSAKLFSTVALMLAVLLGGCVVYPGGGGGYGYRDGGYRDGGYRDGGWHHRYHHRNPYRW